MFLYKGVQKLCIKYTDHPNLLKSHFGMCSSGNLLHIFRTPIPKNESRGLLPSVRDKRHLLPVTELNRICLEKIMGLRQESVCKVGL